MMVLWGSVLLLSMLGDISLHLLPVLVCVMLPLDLLATDQSPLSFPSALFVWGLLPLVLVVRGSVAM